MKTPRTARRPLPTFADVLRAAEAGFAACGAATSLDVKLGLRASGFWAEQASVSDALARLADDRGWERGLAAGWHVAATPRAGGRVARQAVRVGPYVVYWPEGAEPPEAPVAGLDG